MVEAKAGTITAPPASFPRDREAPQPRHWAGSQEGTPRWAACRRLNQSFRRRCGRRRGRGSLRAPRILEPWLRASSRRAPHWPLLSVSWLCLLCPSPLPCHTPGALALLQAPREADLSWACTPPSSPSLLLATLGGGLLTPPSSAQHWSLSSRRSHRIARGGERWGGGRAERRERACCCRWRGHEVPVVKEPTGLVGLGFEGEAGGPAGTAAVALELGSLGSQTLTLFYGDAAVPELRLCSRRPWALQMAQTTTLPASSRLGHCGRWCKCWLPLCDPVSCSAVRPPSRKGSRRVSGAQQAVGLLGAGVPEGQLLVPSAHWVPAVGRARRPCRAQSPWHSALRGRSCPCTGSPSGPRVL